LRNEKPFDEQCLNCDFRWQNIYILESAPLFEMLSNSIHRIYSSYSIAGDKEIATPIIIDLVHAQKYYVVWTMKTKKYEKALKSMPLNISSK